MPRLYDAIPLTKLPSVYLPQYFDCSAHHTIFLGSICRVKEVINVRKCGYHTMIYLRIVEYVVNSSMG